MQLQVGDVRAAAVIQLYFEREWSHLTDVGHRLPVLDDIRVKSSTDKHPWELKDSHLSTQSFHLDEVSVSKG